MQTNTELWLDRTLRTGAVGTWWSAGTPGGGTLGMLQLEPDLVAQEAARQRVAAVVAKLRAANPPGVVRTTELVYETRRAWLVVATVPKPTLADLLAGHGGSPLPTGAAAGLAVDIATALRELHAVGLTHGDLAADTVVLTGAGAAALTEVGVLAAIQDAPADVTRDARAWAALARTLAAVAGAEESGLLVAAATTAESGDLTAAARRLALAAASLPDFETRDALAASLPALDQAAPPRIPAQRESTVDRIGGPDGTVAPTGEAEPTVTVRLRFGPGVPDQVLASTSPVTAAKDEPAPPRRGWLRRLFSRR